MINAHLSSPWEKSEKEVIENLEANFIEGLSSSQGRRLLAHKQMLA